MCLLSAVLGIVMAWTEVLCCWTRSNADCSTDHNSFAEAHLAVIDGQVSHTAHVGPPSADGLWEEEVWQEESASHDWIDVMLIYKRRKTELCSWLTWSSTDEHRLPGICGAGVQRSHHMVHLGVHIQLDNIGVTDHFDQAAQNASVYTKSSSESWIKL